MGFRWGPWGPKSPASPPPGLRQNACTRGSLFGGPVLHTVGSWWPLLRSILRHPWGSGSSGSGVDWIHDPDGHAAARP